MTTELPPLELEIAQLEILDDYPAALTRLRRSDDAWWLVVHLADPPEWLFAIIEWDGTEYTVGLAEDSTPDEPLPIFTEPDRQALVRWVVAMLMAGEDRRRAGLVSLTDLLVLPGKQ